MAEVFAFAFDDRFRRPLALLGVRPGTAAVTVDDQHVSVQFGPWQVRTELANLRNVSVTGPYSWYRVIGPHLSLSDRGVTFGTNSRRGVCLRFVRPVPGLLPTGRLTHPGLTVTVAEPERLRSALARPEPSH